VRDIHRVGINAWHMSNKMNRLPYAQDLLRYTTENNNQDKWHAYYSNKHSDFYP